MTEARRLGHILRTCLTEYDWDRAVPALEHLVQNDDLSALLQRAANHGVDNMVYLRLRALSQELDAELMARFEQRYVGGVRHQLRVLADLKLVATTFESAGIPFLVFKGPVLSATLYRRVDLRSFNDLDVLVPPSAFAGAVEALEDVGTAVLDQNWDLLARLGLGQVHMRLHHGTLVDVHWHLVNRAAVRRSLAIPVEDVFARKRLVVLSGTRVATFEPADTVLHLCLHAALAGGTRLLWLKDIERSVADSELAWEQVVERARDWGTAAPVAAMLQRAERVVGASVPEDVVAELAPSRRARVADAAVDRLWPPEATLGDRGPSAQWMRYRRDRVRTAVSLVAGRRLERWPSARRPPREAHGDDDANGVAVFQPGGDKASRQLFFESMSWSRNGQNVAEPGE